jgi:RNA polymerase sigma-70 factor (ECF subfamily)
VAAVPAAVLQHAIARLPGDQRTVIVMRFVEGRSHAEVARLLGRSPGAVRTLQYRGLRTLRRLLEEAAIA